MAKGRSNARKKAMQALYQWSISGNELKDIEVQFQTEQDMSKVDTDYFHSLLFEVPKNISDLDHRLAPLMDRKNDELDPVEQAILRISTYELLHRLDVPYQVVINEAVDLALSFGADQSHKFVNGVLDTLARDLRKIEVESQKK
ncbi:MAG: transcription antitermination factor NusB [Gammaproteobacteria bacterium]|nr:transcription antitermination factor NusB [Gammaproteobacteria bacterium]